MPEPSTFNFPGIINEALAINKKNISGKSFNMFGVAYTEKEEQVALAEFKKNNDIKEIAKYADVVTHAFPDSIWNQCKDSLTSVSNMMLLPMCNGVSIANIAYIATYAEKYSTRQEAMKLFTS